MLTKKRITCILLALSIAISLFATVPAAASEDGYNIPNTNLYITGGLKDYDWQVLGTNEGWTLVLPTNMPVTLTRIGPVPETPAFVTIIAAAKITDLTLVGVTLDNREFFNPSENHYATRRTASGVEVFMPLPDPHHIIPEPAISVARGSTLNLTIGGEKESALYGYDDRERGRGAIEVPYSSVLNITRESTGTLRAFGGTNAAAIGTCFAICPLCIVGPGVAENGPRYVWLDDENQIQEIEDGGARIPPNQTGGTINIDGGIIYATGGSGAAAIGSGREGVIPNYDDWDEFPSPSDRAIRINISSGAIYAYGGEAAGAIGGGRSSCAVEVKITGGMINARGKGGPAIGMCANGTGPDYNNTANINIAGGVLSLRGMPALGCDGDQYRMTTHITGGYITLEDNTLSTFSGYNADSGTLFNNIVIKGGIVTASKTSGYSIDDFHRYSLYMQSSILRISQGVAGLETLLDSMDNINGIVINGADDLTDPANPKYAGKVYCCTSGLWQVSLSGHYYFTIPNNVHIVIPDNVVLMVNSRYTFTGNENAFVMDTGQIGGAGSWPGKKSDDVVVPAVVPPPTPTYATTGNPNAPVYLGIVEWMDNSKTVVSGSSIDELRKNASGGTLLTVFSGGVNGFTKKADHVWVAENTKGRFSVLLSATGALTAKANSNQSTMTITEADGTVTVSFTNTSLCSPAYMIYCPMNSTDVSEIVFDGAKKMRDSDLAFTVKINPYNNRALPVIPTLSSSKFEITDISPLREKNANRLAGTMELACSICDVAGLNIKQIQLDYDGTKEKLGGIEADGHVAIPTIAGMVSGKAEANINTFPGQGRFKFSLEVETPIFETNGELEFKEARGIWLPNTLYLFVSVDPGIPLVPPTVVAFISGGGLGISNLADTVGMDEIGVPPIKFRGSVKASIVDVFEGTADATVGPSGFEMGFTDVKIAKSIDVIDSMSVFANVGVATKNYQDNDYMGTEMDMGGKIGVALKAAGKTFLSANGEMKLGAFSGLRLDNGKGYVMSRLYSSNSLVGKIILPKGIIAEILPLEDIDLLAADVKMCIGGTTVSEIDPRLPFDNIFKSSAKNFTLNGTVSSTISFDLLVAKGWVRASYVFGGTPSLNAGTGSPPEDDVELFEVGSDTLPRGTSVQFIPNEDGEKNGAYIVECNEYIAASSKDKGISTMEFSNNAGAGVQLISQALNETSYDISIDEAAKYLFTMTPKNGSSFNTSLTNGGFVLEKITDGNAVNVPLIVMERDEAGNTTGNFGVSAERGFFGIPKELGAGTYRISGAMPFDVEAVGFTPFASIDKTETAISENTLQYKLNDRDPNKKYAVSVWLGKEKGATEYLLAETARDENGAFIPITADNGTLTLSHTGTAAPSGDYFVTVQLMEQLTAKENDNTVSSWVAADTHYVAEDFAYTAVASPDAPAAPENVTFTSAGNEKMRATWDAVENADGYIVTVYDEDGEETDMQYLAAADATQLEMALTKDIAGYAGTITENEPIDESKITTTPGLTPGKNYSVGVLAYKKKTLNGQPESEENKAIKINGAEGRSTVALLPFESPPELTYSRNVVFDENDNGTLTLNGGGGSFTVSAKTAQEISEDSGLRDRTVQFSVSATGMEDTAIGTSTSGNTCTVTLPEFVGATMLTITATDSTGDKTKNNVKVIVDNLAPVLTLDDNGTFSVVKTNENKYSGYVTGTTEAGAGVFTWVDGKQINDYADASGTFRIPIISDTATMSIMVQSVDAAGNGSVVLQAATLSEQLSDTEILASLKTAVEDAFEAASFGAYTAKAEIITAVNNAIATSIYRSNTIVTVDDTGENMTVKLEYGTANTTIPLQIRMQPLSILSVTDSNVQIFAPEDTTVRIVFACYNESGNLIDLCTQKELLVSAGTKTYNASASFAASSAGAARVSVFLWNKNNILTPQCKRADKK